MSRDPFPRRAADPVLSRLADRDWMMAELLTRLRPGLDPNLLGDLVQAAAEAGIGPTPLFDPAWYAVRHRLPKGRDPWAHYLAVGAAERLDPHPLFSTAYYVGLMPEAGAPGVNPLQHFLSVGGPAGCDCHPLFFAGWYWAANPDVRAAGFIPIEHFIRHGRTDLRDPSPVFSSAFYVSQHPDAAAARNPLSHFVTHGGRLGLRPHPAFDPAAILATFRGGGGRGAVEAVLAYLGIMGRGTVARAGVPPPPAEPGVRPPAPRMLALPPGTATRAGVAVLEALRPGLEPPGAEYQLAKLDAVQGEAGLPVELAGAMAAGTPRPRLLHAIGLVPACRPATPDPAEFPVPLLRRYRAEQMRVTERLRLRPEAAGTAPGGPLISVLLPVYRTPLPLLERAVLSVLGQTYPDWELCLVDDCSEQPGLLAALLGFAAMDRRVRLGRTRRNGGISAATNLALRLARGSHAALLDHDDMLTRDALATVAARLRAALDTDLVYSDECKIDGDDVAVELFAKPDWSPLLLTSLMYTGHLSVYRTALLRELGGFRGRFDLSQDYDMALRVAERNPRVVHVRKPLYGWRMAQGSAAAGGKPEARLSNVAALQSAMDRRGWAGQAVALPTANRARLDPGPALVSIIVPSDDAGRILRTCMSVVAHTAHQRFELLVVARGDVIAEVAGKLRRNAVKFVAYDQPFNFSAKCNAGAAAAHGRHLVFLNDDVRVLSPDWLAALLECLALPGVGAAAPKLLYEDHGIQHAGMVTGVRRLVGTAFHRYPAGTGAHFNLAQSLREVSLLSGACLAMPAAVFRRVDGFDAVNTPIEHSDVDLCLRVREAGLSLVYTPHAELLHIGHQSRSALERRDPADTYIMQRHGPALQDDPHFPPPLRDLLFLDSQEPFALHVSPNRGRGVAAGTALIVSHQLTLSGAPQVVLDMARALLGAGWYVAVMSPEDGPVRQRLLDAGADVLLEPLALAADPAVLALARSFDLVLGNTVLCWRLLPGLGGVRTALYAHEADLVEELHHAHPGFADSLRTGPVWCGSERSAMALRRIGVKPVVLEYGVDAATVAAAPVAAGLVRVAVLASIEPRKGQDLAIKGVLALPEAVRPLFHLVVAGRRHDPAFHDAVLQLGQGAAGVEFGGEMDPTAYRAALAAADVVLCPSRDDTLPLVSLDALAAGKVLVCSQAVGTAAYIVDGVSGFVLPCNHPDDIAAVLLRVLAARRRWAEVGAAAQAVFRDSFSRERFGARLLALVGPGAPLADAAE